MQTSSSRCSFALPTAAAIQHKLDEGCGMTPWDEDLGEFSDPWYQLFAGCCLQPVSQAVSWLSSPMRYLVY